MNLGDLINAFGEDVQFQLVDECAVNARMVRGGTHLTIGTDAITPRDLIIDPDKRSKMGFVVWLDRATKVKELIEADRAAKETSRDHP